MNPHKYAVSNSSLKFKNRGTVVILFAESAVDAVKRILQLSMVPVEDLSIEAPFMAFEPVLNIIVNPGRVVYQVSPICPLCKEAIKKGEDALFFEFGSIGDDDGWIHTSCASHAMEKTRQDQESDEDLDEVILGSMGMDRYGSLPSEE